jgi:hypothetical protein
MANAESAQSLSQVLSVPESTLLDTLWDRTIGSAQSQGEWPQWDFLERRMFSQLPDLEGAVEVLAGLPSMSKPASYGATYGLVWRTQGGTPSPMSEERLGLSIAGLTRVSNRRNSAVCADRLVAVLRDLALVEESLPADPSKPAQAAVCLDDYASFVPTREEPFAMTVEEVAMTLQREYDNPVSPYEFGGKWWVQLAGNRLRRFRKFESATQYVVDIHARAGKMAAKVYVPTLIHESEPQGMPSESPRIFASAVPVGENFPY